MRIVVALGGNALLQRGERPDAAVQQAHVARAVQALAPIARHHEIVVTHGNGPQVGLLARESGHDPELSRPYPFDALGAETQGLIGYWLQQGLGNALPGRRVVALITQTLVDRDDPALSHPTKPVGPVMDEPTAHRLSAEEGWSVAPDGKWWRRVVPSPQPREIVELDIVEKLLAFGAVVICAGGGGVPVVRDPAGHHSGIEAVVDKDHTAALLAEQLHADRLVLLTDVRAVEIGYGTPAATPLHRVTPQQLSEHVFATGSMGPKVDACCRFVERTGGVAAIGALSDVAEIIAGCAGTTICPSTDRAAGHRPVGTPVSNNGYLHGI